MVGEKGGQPCADAGKEETMYRIIKFQQSKGKTLARFHTEEEIAAYHCSSQEQSGSSDGEVTKKHCVVEFERGTDNCMILAQFDTSKEAEKYYQTVKDKHKPFGPFFILVLELQPNGDYDDLQRKPNYKQTGSWGKK